VTEGQEELPPALAAAWGRKARPGKGPKPGLSLEGIVDAGVRVAVAEGIGAVSMARVAKELGAATMSLYRYVAAKNELLELMVDAALGGPVPAPGDDEDWRAGLSRWAWGYHARLRAHPWALRVPIGGMPMTPNAVAWLEDGLRALRDTGLREHEKASSVLVLSSYVRGEATLVAELSAGMLAAPDPDGQMLGYAQMMRTLTDRERFPALYRVLDARVFDKADDPDEEFSFGLERILDGIGWLIASRGQPGPRRRGA
jgi:AcrR family transcriptional regulator